MTLLALLACASDPEDSAELPEPTLGTILAELPDGRRVETSIAASAEPGAELAVRITWDPQRPARYPDGRPVVLIARGSVGPGSFLDQRGMIPWQQAGFVVVEVLLPGGSSDGRASTGTFDTRGPFAQSAFADAAHFTAGDTADLAGLRFADHVPDALPWFGVTGMSNGVNLALLSVAREAAALDAARFLVAWEGPYTDQFLDVELESYEFHLNPAYELGSCENTVCPMPALPAMLQFDPTATSFSEAPLLATRLDLPGILYVDEDGDGVYRAPEYWWHMMSHDTGDGVYVCTPSVELSTMLDQEAGRLFPDGRPAWLPTTEWVTGFWAERDASLFIPALAQARPDLAVIVAASQEDHIYLGVPDNPHIGALTRFLQDEGLRFVRLNPDATYLSALAGAPLEALPDNEAGTSPEWPDTPEWLEPELRDSILDRYTAAAAALELADRVQLDQWAPNLDAPLVPVPTP